MASIGFGGVLVCVSAVLLACGGNQDKDEELSSSSGQAGEEIQQSMAGANASGSVDAQGGEDEGGASLGGKPGDGGSVDTGGRIAAGGRSTGGRAGLGGANAGGANAGGAPEGGRNGFGGAGNGGASRGGTSNLGGTPIEAGASPGGASPGGSAGLGEGGNAGEAGIAEGGSAGSAPEPGNLVLDPDTLIFFSPDTSWIGAAVTGYDPVARACATIEFFGPANELALGAYCVTGPSYTIKVAVALDQEGPCEPPPPIGNWQDATTAEGCIEFSELTGRKLDLIDAVVETEGSAFTGRITADNRSSDSPNSVTFGLTFFTDTPETVFVQDPRNQGWFSVLSDEGDPLTISPACLPDCGTGEETDMCPDFVGMVSAIVTDGYEGSAFATWDGTVYEVDKENRCQTKTLAPNGNYQVRMCFGYNYNPIDSGDWLIDPTCVTEEFTLPTDSVLVNVDAGG